MKLLILISALFAASLQAQTLAEITPKARPVKLRIFMLWPDNSVLCDEVAASQTPPFGLDSGVPGAVGIVRLVSVRPGEFKPGDFYEGTAFSCGDGGVPFLARTPQAALQQLAQPPKKVLLSSDMERCAFIARIKSSRPGAGGTLAAISFDLTRPDGYVYPRFEGPEALLIGDFEARSKVNIPRDSRHRTAPHARLYPTPTLNVYALTCVEALKLWKAKP